MRGLNVLDTIAHQLGGLGIEGAGGYYYDEGVILNFEFSCLISS